MGRPASPLTQTMKRKIWKVSLNPPKLKDLPCDYELFLSDGKGKPMLYFLQDKSETQVKPVGLCCF